MPNRGERVHSDVHKDGTDNQRDVHKDDTDNQSDAEKHEFGHELTANNKTVGHSDDSSDKLADLMHSDTMILIIFLIIMIILALIFRALCLKLTTIKERKRKIRGGIKQIATHMDIVMRSMADEELPNSPQTVMKTYSNYHRKGETPPLSRSPSQLTPFGRSPSQLTHHKNEPLDDREHHLVPRDHPQTRIQTRPASCQEIRDPPDLRIQALVQATTSRGDAKALGSSLVQSSTSRRDIGKICHQMDAKALVNSFQEAKDIFSSESKGGTSGRGQEFCLDRLGKAR